MKVLFINPPVIRSPDSGPDNGFRVKGFIYQRRYHSVPGLIRLFRALRFGRNVRYGVRAGSRWPWTAPLPVGGVHYPFIMAYAAAYIRSQGFDVQLFDAVAAEEYSYARFLRKIREACPDIVVLETSAPTFDIDIWFAAKVAKFAQVALAGPHLTENARDIQARYPFVTFLLEGEYILSSHQMVVTRRPGIYPSTVVQDLDAIPFAFREFEEAPLYYDPSMPTARPQLQVYASKGCPFSCVFCLWPRSMYQSKVSFRKPESVAQEIRECIARHQYKSIFFDDDTFNIGTERISTLCDELEKIGLPWTMMGRLDCSPTWLYDKMVASGCVGMRFGVETFDAGVLKRIKKGLLSERIEETLDHIRRHHPQLMIHLTMMKDLPGQTDAIHQRDLRILHDLGFSPNNPLRSYQLSACAPFPGTELYSSVVEKLGESEASCLDGMDGGTETVMKKLKAMGIIE